MAQAFKVLHGTTVAALLLLVFGLPPVLSQDGAPKQVGEPKFRSLIMAMKTKQSTTDVDLKVTFEDFVLKLNTDDNDKSKVLFNWKDIKVVPIKKDAYDALAKLLVSGFIDTPQNLGPAAIIPAPQDQKTWEIVLADANLFIKKIRLKFVGEKESVSYESKQKERLRLLGPGRYVLSLDKIAKPQSYQITAFDPVAEKNVELPEQPWPQASEGYWLIELAGFSGDMEALFEVLTNKRTLKLPNPFRDMSDARATTVVVGSLLKESLTPGHQFHGNLYTTGFPLLGSNKERAERYWIYFPIEGKDIKKYVDLYTNKLKFNQAAIIKEIKKVGVKVDKEHHVLTPGMEPQWFELPRVGNRIERTFKVDNILKWKAQGQQKLYRLVVAEFDNGVIQGAVEVQHPRGGDDVFVIDEEVLEWPIGIQNLKENKDKK